MDLRSVLHSLRCSISLTFGGFNQMKTQSGDEVMLKSTIALFTLYIIVAHGLLDIFDGVHFVFSLLNLGFVLALILVFQFLKSRQDTSEQR